MQKCCDDHPGILVPYVKGDKTCRVSAAALKIFNSYTLNKQQDMKKNNTLDFKSSKLAKAYAKDAVRQVK